MSNEITSTQNKPRKKADNLKGYWFMVVFRNKKKDFECDISDLILISDSRIKEYAYIFHDKDKSKTKHFHLVLHTFKQTTLQTIAKLFNIKVADVELVDVPNKAIRYLIHADNKEKEQYTIDNVVTNMNYNFITPILDTTHRHYVKDRDNALLYLLNLIQTNDIQTYDSLVDVVANNEPSLLSIVMGKRAYSLSAYINSRKNKERN